MEWHAEVNATNLKNDCVITDDTESCSAPLDLVYNDIDNGEDDGQRSEQSSTEMMICEVAMGDSCSMVSESSADTALPITDLRCKRVKDCQIDCCDSEGKFDTLQNTDDAKIQCLTQDGVEQSLGRLPEGTNMVENATVINEKCDIVRNHDGLVAMSSYIRTECVSRESADIEDFLSKETEEVGVKMDCQEMGSFQEETAGRVPKCVYPEPANEHSEGDHKEITPMTLSDCTETVTEEYSIGDFKEVWECETAVSGIRSSACGKSLQRTPVLDHGKFSAMTETLESDDVDQQRDEIIEPAMWVEFLRLDGKAEVIPAVVVSKPALTGWIEQDAAQRIQPAKSTQEGDTWDVNRKVPCAVCGQWGHGFVTCLELWGPPQHPPCQKSGQVDHEIWTGPAIWSTISWTDEVSPEIQSALRELTTVLERRIKTDNGLGLVLSDMTERVNGTTAEEPEETDIVRVAAGCHKMGNGKHPSDDSSKPGAPVTQTAQVLPDKDWIGRKKLERAMRGPVRFRPCVCPSGFRQRGRMCDDAGQCHWVFQCWEWKRTRKKLERAVRGPVSFRPCVCPSRFRQRGRMCDDAWQSHWVEAYFGACVDIAQHLLIAQVCAAFTWEVLGNVQGSSWERELRVPGVRRAPPREAARDRHRERERASAAGS